MKSNIRYIIIEEGTRVEIQTKLNQWLSLGYDLEVEHFIHVEGTSYTAVIRRWNA